MKNMPNEEMAVLKDMILAPPFLLFGLLSQ